MKRAGAGVGVDYVAALVLRQGRLSIKISALNSSSYAVLATTGFNDCSDSLRDLATKWLKPLVLVSVQRRVE